MDEKWKNLYTKIKKIVYCIVTNKCAFKLNLTATVSGYGIIALTETWLQPSVYNSRFPAVLVFASHQLPTLTYCNSGGIRRGSQVHKYAPEAYTRLHAQIP